jgi:hypothetical protein
LEGEAVNVTKLLPIAIVLVVGLVVFVVWPKGQPPSPAQGDPPSPRPAPTAQSANVPLMGTPSGSPSPSAVSPPAPAPAAAPVVAPPAPAPSPPPPAASSEQIEQARAAVARADVLIASDQPLAARTLLEGVMNVGLPEADLAGVRQRIDGINQKLVFSPTITPGDPGCEAYVLRRGDTLQQIAQEYDIDWRLIRSVNNIADVRLIRAGWRLKVLKGPFHAVVHKRDFRLEVYQGTRFVCQFRVGLGADNATPLGKFVVDNKLANPPWRNPRTGQQIKADDPRNPLGEHWIGLKGAEPATASLEGYGIHGTIEPQSIGTQASMGCVRMLAADVERLFSMVVVGKSSVTIAE